MPFFSKTLVSSHHSDDNFKVKIAYITNIATPYRAAMIESWVKFNPRFSMSVFYTESGDQGRGWSVSKIKEANEHRLPVAFSINRYGNLNYGLWKIVRDNDVIIIGGFEQASYLLCATIAFLARKPTILLLDGFSPARFGKESRIILMVKHLTARLCSVFFANGKASEVYLREYVRISPQKKIFNQFLSHNDTNISAARTKYELLGKQQLRNNLMLPQNKAIFICCGYLIRRKRLDIVLKAFSAIPYQERPFLLIVGDGPLKDELILLAKQLSIDTHFTGFKQGIDLAQFYFSSDAMILASEDDPWGLVVNEAMSAGLPIIVSDACGAAQDLVENGKNGFIFPNGNISELSNAIINITTINMSEMGNHSRRIISSWTTEASAKSLSCCIDSLIKTR